MRRLLAVCLLVGFVLLGVGSVMHPMLHGDAASQLQGITASAHFRAIHLAMLAGSALVMAGIWTRIFGMLEGDRVRIVAAFALIDIGFALNAYDIAFMANAGGHLATVGPSAALLFDALHAIGLMYARFGNTLVALGALILAVAEWPIRRTPAVLAGLAAFGGFVGVLACDETSPLALAAVALLSGWSIVTAIHALRLETWNPTSA